MSEEKLISADALCKKINKMPFYVNKDRENVLWEILSAPTVEAETVWKWISISDRLPDVETEVLILANRNDDDIITTAIYEDGSVNVYDSCWFWDDLDLKYDEENDTYLIPEGWWEQRHYDDYGMYGNHVGNVVTHWMYLPKSLKEKS